MQVKKKVIVPEHEEERVDYSICDICQQRIRRTQFVVEEVEIFARTGNSFPEGGSGEKTEFDICIDCFQSKVIPALKELGAEPRTTEWEW